jgi:sugar phosphate isomerase/epimerase
MRRWTSLSMLEPFRVSSLSLLFVLMPTGVSQSNKPEASVAAASARDDSAAEKLGWRLCLQASSIPDANAFDAIDLAAKLGFKRIELDPDQALSRDEPSVRVGPDMTDEQRERLARKLARTGVKAESFGIVGFKNDEAHARRIFDFAKATGVETLICQPNPDACRLVDRLCNEYKINAAIYNPERPARFWQPEEVSNAVYWCSHRPGACADIANWSRSGLWRGEAMHELRGRILAIRLRDMDEIAKQLGGSSRGMSRDLLIDLHEREFQGVICLECTTTDSAAVEPELTRRIASFDATAKALAAETPIEMHVSDSVSVTANWYQDAYRRADAADVDCRVVRSEDGSLILKVASKEARKTSGIGVDIRISKNVRRVAEAHVRGLWWADRGPSHDVLDSITGVVSVSSADFNERPLCVQFTLDTKWSGCPKTVSGGIRIPR